MASQQRPLALPQETEATDLVRELVESIGALRKEVTELRSRVETNDLTRKNIPSNSSQVNSAGLGLGDALALIKSTQNDTITLITGLLATVSKQQADSQTAFFKGIQFNEAQTSKIISRLTAEEAAAADSNGDGRVSLGEFAEVLLEKGMELMAGAHGDDGELNGMEEHNALPRSSGAGPRPAFAGNGGPHSQENN